MGQSGPLVLDILGVRVAVMTDRHGHAALRDALAPISTDVSSNHAGRSGADRFDCSIDVEVPDVEAVVGAALVAAIEHSRDLLVHAGAVSWNGQLVLFPGVSGLGKSTMTAACLVRGFAYLSDEAIAIDLVTGRVTGLPRPLMLTHWSMRAVGLEAVGDEPKQAVAAERIGGRRAVGTGISTGAVAHVVSMRRDAGAAVLEPMTAGEVLALVLASSFNHYRHGARAWEAATQLSRGARGWHLDISDLDRAADAVAELFSP